MQRKTLTSIVFTGALALNGCNEVYDSRYDFNGTFGNEHIVFIRNPWPLSDLILTVEKEDGRIVKYYDWNNDLKVDEVAVGEDVYQNDVVGEQALKVAQEQFNDYLNKILVYKQQKAVEAIK